MVSPGPAPERLLLVEGYSEERVITHLCKSAGLVCDFKIDIKRGVDPLLSSIRNEINVPGRRILGIVVDANQHVGRRWQAVGTRLNSANIAVPSRPSRRGTILESTPRVGIWLMPDNFRRGQLEDFVAAMVPTHDNIWPLAKKYVASIPAADRSVPPAKAEVHAWLAARTGGLQMGTAIKAGSFDQSIRLAQDFVSWIDRLFRA